MKEFIKPTGVCFLFGELSASTLSNTLCKITNFLQNVDSHAKLHLYDDWWEHDGLHFYKSLINFDTLYQLINSPKNLLESTPEDFAVFAGITSDSNTWYLRYRVEWNDDDETNLIGSCAVVLPVYLTEKFKFEVLEKIETIAKEIDSHIYYNEVIS